MIFDRVILGIVIVAMLILSVKSIVAGQWQEISIPFGVITIALIVGSNLREKKR